MGAGLPDPPDARQAIAGYTRDGAYTEFMEDRKGRLKPGYLADLAVLSGDIETTEPERLQEIRPVTPYAMARSATKHDLA